MRLNLGCNDRIKEGWTNVDFDSRPGVDLVSDVSKLDLPSGCADVVLASNILEHFPQPKTLEVLKEWARLLKPGGILEISVPDFDRTIEIYHKTGLTDWAVNFLWGDQGYPGAFHYTGFNEPRLRKFLEQAGFEDISRVEYLPSADKNECSYNVSNLDRKPVCLNMIAVKGI
jgi:predicted SAM-dependent methyltransferase